MRTPRWLQDLPLPIRGAVLGAIALGVVGCVAGLAVGLRVYPPTAWAATVEVGLPSAALGAALGALIGLSCGVGPRLRRSRGLSGR